MKSINWKDEKKRAYWKNILFFQWDRFFSRRHKNQWVFGGREGYNYDDNSRFLFEWVNKNHPELKTAWMCRTTELQRYIQGLGCQAYLFGSKDGVEFCKHAGVVCYSHGLQDIDIYPRVGGAFIVTYWHGAGFKKVYNLSHHGISLFVKKIADKFFSWTYRNLTIGTSEFHLKQLTGCFNLKDSDYKAICGQPRNDVLFSNIKKEDVLANLGIDHKKNIILYMPTYRGAAMGTDSMEKIIRSLYDSKKLDKTLTDSNSVLVAKLHPLTPRIECQNRDNFVILDYSAIKNNQELLAVGDMMISDYSATIVDFALLKRPIIFFMPDHEKFVKCSEPIFDEFFDLCKNNRCYTPDELSDLILHRSLSAVDAINDLFDDSSLKGSCYCENVYNEITKYMGE